MDGMRDRFERMRGRHENGTAPKAVAVWQLFQTPEHIAERMAGMLGLMDGMAVLEPSAGLGRLLNAVYSLGVPCSVSACEISPDLAGHLFTGFPDIQIAQGDFLGRELGEFDRVVMNPPFHMRADIAHIRHAIGHLKRGGRCVGLCMAGSARESFLESIGATWEELPAGTFRESGTNVATYLFTFDRD